MGDIKCTKEAITQNRITENSTLFAFLFYSYREAKKKASPSYKIKRGKGRTINGLELICDTIDTCKQRPHK